MIVETPHSPLSPDPFLQKNRPAAVRVQCSGGAILGKQ